MAVVIMFKEIAITKKSKAFRKKVYGVGINDAPYLTHIKINGKDYNCPYYSRWCGILQRSYCPNYEELHPSYEGVIVCDKWISFMCFRAWMQTQEHKHKNLDKDIIKPDNKVYCPEFCCFITQKLNKLLTSRSNHRGSLPIGITKSLRGGFRAAININGSRKILGFFKTVEEASEAFNNAKAAYILTFVAEQTDPRIANGLRLHAQLYREGKVK